MGPTKTTKALGLTFTRYDLSENDSIAFAFADDKERCGIYILEFENGERYVGQTISMPDRYAAHRRHHGDIVAVSFAPCSDDLLDEYERLVVHHQEQSFDLRNLTLTNWPGGREDLNVTFGDGVSSMLPWDRDRRPSVDGVSKTSPIARYWRLRERDDYPQLLELLGTFVARALPDPVLTERSLWSLTALPSTTRWDGHYRLCTLNAGNLEVLVVAQDRDADGTWWPDIFFNLWDDDLANRLPKERFTTAEDLWFEKGGYRMSDSIMTIGTASYEAALEALGNDVVLDATYHLTTHLMRRGGRLFAKAHNRYFASDVLYSAHRASSR